MYVYALRSLRHPTQFYIGRTVQLRERLREHNAGESAHTSKYRPWQLQFAIWLPSIDKAAAFERYLKSHSGKAFASKHF